MVNWDFLLAMFGDVVLQMTAIVTAIIVSMIIAISTVKAFSYK